jgi:hypothetical protein
MDDGEDGSLIASNITRDKPSKDGVMNTVQRTMFYIQPAWKCCTRTFGLLRFEGAYSLHALYP